jgi:uncharacterized membrane protein YeaQ/YmgE (transglycosylase-associated protein family)
MGALIISLLSGAVGGNIVGRLYKNLSLGTLWNSIIGILGGGIGGQLLGALGVFGGDGSSALNMGNIIANILSSGVGGGVLLAIIGFVKKLMAK